MEQNQEKKCCAFFTVGTPQCGLLMGLCGLAVAFMLLFIGFWKTLFVALLFTVGYLLGRCSRKQEVVKTTINKMFPPKGE